MNKKIRLTIEREQKGWTKMKLGFETDIHPSVIGKLEAGKIFAYEPWKEKLSKVFGISSDELFKEV